MDKKTIISLLEEKGYVVQESKTNKNGEEYEAIIIRGREDEEERNVCPTFRIKDIENMQIEEIVEMIEDGLNKSFPASDIEKILNDREYVLNNIFICANRSTNTKCSDLFQHDNTLDIDYYIRLVLSNDCFGTGTVTLRKSMLEDLQIGERTIWRIADENTEKNTEVKGMLETIIDIADEELDESLSEMIKEEELNPIKMLVVTSKDRRLGSGILHNRKFFQNFAKEHMLKNFIVIPSSTHELIIVTDEEFGNVKMYTDMVNEVNENQVTAEEQLADRAFIFSSVEGFI